jgi:2-polyprenyl-6-methoxyphenol hydroxylase-like FAD-dependent oxidoreductase
MTETLIVAGAGIAGLNAAMALPRAGRSVIVVDRDPPPPDTSPDDAFYQWDRKGVTQLRHSHVFLGKLVKLIREQHPRLWQDLLDAGARESTFEEGLPPTLRSAYTYEKGDEDMSFLFSRRSTLELVMRRYAASLPGVTFITNAGIRGIVTEQRDGLPAITGLKVTIDGKESIISGDAVIDATGRDTQFPEWLAEVGGSVEQDPSPAGILYFTRHYRLRDGQDEPERDGTAGAGDLGYIKFGVFPADNRHFSITLAVPEIETAMRTAILKPEVFDHMCAMMPGAARWTNADRAEPVSKVFAMGNLKNLWRVFVRDGKPAALNFFPIGDAALRTNPLYGRGCSMGAIQAHILAEVMDAERDPSTRMLAFNDRVKTELRPFFDVMAKQDAQAIKRALQEQDPGYRPSFKAKLMKSFIEDAIGPASRSDIKVLRAIMKPFHMLEDPTLWTKRAPIMARVLKAWATPKVLKKKLYQPEFGPRRDAALRTLNLPAG